MIKPDENDHFGKVEDEKRRTLQSISKFDSGYYISITSFLDTMKKQKGGEKMNDDRRHLI